MAQRLNLARVLMQTPDLLLLDEPGTGLDAASLALLRSEVVAARARGACIVFISHDWAGDAPLADRLLALEGRKLAYDGPPGAYRPVAAELATAMLPDMSPGMSPGIASGVSPDVMTDSAGQKPGTAAGGAQCCV